MDANAIELQRQALHRALQDWVREHEDDGVILNAVLCMEISDTNGQKYLAHRNFNIEGERCLSWDCEKLLRDALRAADIRARDGLTGPEDDEED